MKGANQRILLTPGSGFILPCRIFFLCIHKTKAKSLVFSGCFLSLSPCPLTRTSPSCSGLASLCAAPWSICFRHIHWTFELKRSPGSHSDIFSPFWWVAIIRLLLDEHVSSLYPFWNFYRKNLCLYFQTGRDTCKQIFHSHFSFHPPSSLLGLKFSNGFLSS